MNEGNVMETDGVKQEICEKYCRYTSGILEIRQEELDEICDRCPLVRLEKEVCQNEKQRNN